MIKKITCCFAAIFFAAFLGILIYVPFVYNTSAAELNFDYRIVIDAGHGYPDGGASGVFSGVKESDINLSIAQILAKLCKQRRIEPVLTRNSQNTLASKGKNLKKRDMEKRRDIIKKTAPDLIVSIHLNTFSDRSRSGAQVFFDKNNKEGLLLASCVQSSLNTINERKYIHLRGDYYILNCTSYAAIIVECGFLSNPDEEKTLQTAEYQTLLAEKILEGIVLYLLK